MSTRFPEPDHRSKAEQIADRRRQNQPLPIRFLLILAALAAIVAYYVWG